MVTGASTADLAIVLIDARRGPLEQSRRHAYLSSLLGIRHIIVAVNKMDLIGWNQATFRAVEEQFGAFLAKLAIPDVTYIPLSALHGENVVDRSTRSPWYLGPTLLEHLEKVTVAEEELSSPARFPVQWVSLPSDGSPHEERGYAGRVASGVFAVGDEVTVLPSGRTTRIAAIQTWDGDLDEARSGRSVTLKLVDDLDVSRGDLICGSSPAVTSQELKAMLCWMDDRPLQAGGRYSIRHTTNTARAIVRDLHYRVDVNSMTTHAVRGLGLNDIGLVTLRTTAPLSYDPYSTNRTTGSFILVDETTNATAGVGMLIS